MYSAAMALGSVVGGGIVASTMDAIPMRAAIPATGSGGGAQAKVTASGQPVTGDMTARQIVFLSAFYVIGAMVILILGARVLKDARIA